MALTIALLAEGALFYSVLGRERSPLSQPLDLFSTRLADWRMVSEGRVDNETQEVLRADDSLVRVYAKPGYPPADLFVAYFKSQRTGQSPHSPKNCLPGAGWEPISEGYVDVAVPGERAPLKINRYIVVKGNDQILSLYWYQSRRRVIASEFAARFWLVVDSIRYRRSDTSLVRITVPVAPQASDPSAAAIDFLQALYPVLRSYLPQ